MSLRSEDVMFGCDPELCIVSNTDGSGVPAWEITEGRKERHYPIYYKIKGLEVHADGVALEFNIPPQTKENFTGVVRNAMAAIKETFPNVSFFNYPELSYNKNHLKHPLALAAGCDPDFCAYDNPILPRILEPNTSELRFFGGHLHVGYPKELIPPWALVRVMDALWYLRAISQGHDLQGKRRSVYGKAGIFREKSYGVEYRTPSTFWLTKLRWADSFCVTVFDFLNSLTAQPALYNNWFNSVIWEEVKRAIDTEDMSACSRKYSELTQELSRRTGKDFF